MKKPILLIKDLTVNYYTIYGVVNALDSVNLTLYEGETLAIVGESGCGKSTLAKAILRILPGNAAIVRGEIIFDPEGSSIDLTRLPEEELVKIRGRKISMIFQEPSSALSPVHNVRKQITDHVMESLGSDVIKRAIDLLSKLRMPSPPAILEKYPHELSGGMKQRVVIAASLITNPKILIADEPTTALDVTVQAQILRLLMELKKELKTTVMFITHNLAIAAEIADRVAVMYAGHIVEVADTESLFENPLHPYTIGLLKSIPKPHIDEEIEPIPGEPPNLINPPKGCRYYPRCPYALSKCRDVKPSLKSVNEHRYVACHLRVR